MSYTVDSISVMLLWQKLLAVVSFLHVKTQKGTGVESWKNIFFTQAGTLENSRHFVIRELKHRAFLLSRRPNGTKLSADIAYLNTSCGRGDRHGGLQGAFCLRVGLSQLQCFFVFFFIKGMVSSTKQIVNKSF